MVMVNERERERERETSFCWTRDIEKIFQSNKIKNRKEKVC